ncbi:MAG: hypothetical protein D3914_04740 [Candidatus Electrothrix sp. LOE2]|nr:hypothetical protein [Candidatus Electrothrix sp. LOE2]
MLRQVGVSRGRSLCLPVAYPTLNVQGDVQGEHRGSPLRGPCIQKIQGIDITAELKNELLF